MEIQRIRGQLYMPIVSPMTHWSTRFLSRETWLSRTLRKILETAIANEVISCLMVVFAYALPFLFIPFVIFNFISVVILSLPLFIIFGGTLQNIHIFCHNYQEPDPPNDSNSILPPGEDELLYQFKELELEVRLRDLKEEAGIFLKRIMHSLRITPQPHPL